MSYEEKLELAKGWLTIAKENSNKLAIQILENLFPELLESDDEKIRKSLIKSFENQHSCNFPTVDGFTREQIIAWLKKQSKQNYIDVDEDWYGFVRWFVKERTDNYTLIPSDDDIHNWGNIILNHARKLLEKQEWGEEDEKMLDNCIGLIQEIDSTQEEQNWLNSLKDRVQPQPKQEWSEKDNERIERIYHFIWKNRKGDTSEIYQQEQDAEWLKSLKPNHWKPSEQNIKDLEWCADLVQDKLGVGFHRLQVFIDEIKNL